MKIDLGQKECDAIANTSEVHSEFANKVKELNRRLRMNGMDYSHWSTLNPRQQDVFSANLFLTPESANSVDLYVGEAADSCGCPDTEEDLYHHSPLLMKNIDAHRNPMSMGHIQKTNEGLEYLIDKVISDYRK